jgi:hypothetical protein
LWGISHFSRGKRIVLDLQHDADAKAFLNKKDSVKMKLKNRIVRVEVEIMRGNWEPVPGTLNVRDMEEEC